MRVKDESISWIVTGFNAFRCLSASDSQAWYLPIHEQSGREDLGMLEKLVLLRESFGTQKENGYSRKLTRGLKVILGRFVDRVYVIWRPQWPEECPLRQHRHGRRVQSCQRPRHLLATRQCALLIEPLMVKDQY